MEESILESIKQASGFTGDEDDFDAEVITYANGRFATLHQLGVGPKEGFIIEDNGSHWGEFSSNKMICALTKDYICTAVRIKFDPPQNATLLKYLIDYLPECESRLRDYAELDF